MVLYQYPLLSVSDSSFSIHDSTSIILYSVGDVLTMTWLMPAFIMSFLHIMQLLVPVLPSLEKLKREGEPGYNKINQYTRYLTILVCLVQGVLAAMAMNTSRAGQM